jgi:molybdenum-dependent DNA-binding transcriptional regulator ModE
MTYKRAGLLDRINGAFTEPVVIAAPGGHGGDDLTALPHRAARTPNQKLIT